jgi:cell division protein FtsI (penicillin-binding protein 3)
VLLARLGSLQLAEGASYRAQAEARHRARHTVRSTRGRILDAQGRVLVASRRACWVGVDPRPGIVEDLDEFAVRLAGLLDDRVSAPRIRERVLAERRREKPRGSVVLVPWVEDERILERLDEVRSARDARRLGLFGVVVQDLERRTYPNGTHARAVLGSPPDPDGSTPGSGVEAALDGLLAGTEVEAPARRDGRRNLQVEGKVDRSPALGRDIRLTIDAVVQHHAETALDDLVAAWSPPEAVAVVLDPATGGVLAMASRRDGKPDGMNLAALGAYEPGSAWKPFTVAQALAIGITDPDEVLPMPSYASFEGVSKPVTDSHEVGDGTVVRLVAHSSNTGAALLAMRLGREGMKALFDRLGLGRRTGIELPGEATAVVSEPRWPLLFLSRSGYGQGFAISPIQLAACFAAFARDDARVVRPTLLPGSGGPRLDLPPVCASRRDLETIRRGLEGCVDEGTARDTVGGCPWPVAGKTGTAQIAGTEWLVCTFCGYAPREAPRVLVLVMAKTRRDEVRRASGSSIAGPAVRSIVERTLAYRKVPPSDIGSPESDR